MNKKILVGAIASSLLSAMGYAEETNNSKWQASIIAETLYVDRSNESVENTIEGMPSGGHSHGFEDGLQLGHNEIVVTGDITNNISTRLTTIVAEKPKEEGGGLEVELEEAFIAAQGLGQGFDLKAGRFFSDIGYHSSKHNHEWDFAEQPLIYDGMFGAHPIGDGLQLNYLVPTDTFLKFGIELFADDEFPRGDTSKAISAATAYAKIGGDIGTDHSWLAGIGHSNSNDITRNGEAHHHHEEEGHDDEEGSATTRFTGDSSISTIGGVYKWAPNGNSKERNFKFQAEYFQRDEDGTVNIFEDDGTETSSYDGDQSGWYAQAVYQFQPHLRFGIRHDSLKIDNKGDEEVLEESGLSSEGHRPKRNSIMLDYSPREYSRFRVQYNRDERNKTPDNQIIFQYIHSFGSHGAHAF